MQRRQTAVRKHPSATRHSPLGDLIDKDIYHFDNKVVPEDMREQLRAALEELEHNRLTSDLEIQKRLLVEQQLRSAQQENEELQADNQQLKRELSKLAKKYTKAKGKKDCQRCKAQEDLSCKLEKQREIYANDRKIMQEEIKSLKAQLQNAEATQERDRLLVLTESLYKEIGLANKKIEQQSRIIHFLNDKLSQFERENIEIVKNVDLLENKLSEIEIDSLLHKRKECPTCVRARVRGEEGQSSASRAQARRRNGSIQNVKKTERDESAWQLERYES